MVQSFKKFGFAVLVTVFGAFSVNAQSDLMWKIDKAHTSVNFSVNHFFSSVTGKFTSFEGDINFDRNNLKSSKVDFTVLINSVNTDDKKRDEHLQSSEFFDVQVYPNMTFKSTKVEKKSEKEYSVYGKLTIKDITKDVVLPMKITGEMEHPMMKGKIILGVLIDTTLNRTVYGVGTGDWATTMVVGDEVRIQIPMELNRMK
ncbi:YceI family protein [Polaribacter sp. L3A8]|uniref:YceI family protein n=1 Tax=Polaribacter sp. L3A8 TaxID=2686361 RepID=UPI0018EF1BBA|nr:YceI family protein [Polaribacter sp. L3A8]